MLRPADNLILQCLANVVKVIAITRYAHNEPLVPFGVSLGIPQGFGIRYIELDMVPVEAEITADQSS